MIGMNIGDQNQIGLGEPIAVSLTPWIDVNRLTPRLNQHAGMPDDRNLHRSGTGLELLHGPRCLRKQNNAGQQQSANNLHMFLLLSNRDDCKGKQKDRQSRQSQSHSFSSELSYIANHRMPQRKKEQQRGPHQPTPAMRKERKRQDRKSVV